MLANLVAISVLIVITVFQTAQDQTVQPPLDLRLTVNPETPTVGQSVVLKVELRNHSEQDVFVGRLMQPFVQFPAYVDFTYFDGHGHFLLLDQFTGLRASRTNEDWWIPIASGHFYGAEWYVTPESHEFLSRPGKYCIEARYVSKAADSPNSQGPTKPPSIVWRGEIKSDRVCIDVVAARRP